MLGPSRPKSLKKVSGRSEKPRKTRFWAFSRLFGLSPRLFSDFWGARVRAPFRDFFQTFGVSARRLLLPGRGDPNSRERKMRTKFFCTNFSNTPNGPGHPGKIPGTSRIPLFETQGRQTFEGGHEIFGHHPFEWKTPTPPGGLRTQKVYLCALFSCLKFGAPGKALREREGGGGN